ncbi:dihydrofolate reductase family protein [Nitrospirota bacterium]
MANYVYIAASLDGYIAAPDGGIDWLMEIPIPEGDNNFAEFMSKIDALVMGRNTFEMVVSFGEWIYDKPVFVLSNTLTSVPENLAGKAEPISGELSSVVEQLNSRGYKNLYIDGGKTIQSFMEADMIDHLFVTRVSLLLGDGIPLFGTLSKSMKFKHVQTEVLTEDLVQGHYVRDRG